MFCEIVQNNTANDNPYFTQKKCISAAMMKKEVL